MTGWAGRQVSRLLWMASSVSCTEILDVRQDGRAGGAGNRPAAARRSGRGTAGRRRCRRPGPASTRACNVVSTCFNACFEVRTGRPWRLQPAKKKSVSPCNPRSGRMRTTERHPAAVEPATGVFQPVRSFTDECSIARPRPLRPWPLFPVRPSPPTTRRRTTRTPPLPRSATASPLAGKNDCAAGAGTTSRRDLEGRLPGQFLEGRSQGHLHDHDDAAGATARSHRRPEGVLARQGAPVHALTAGVGLRPTTTRKRSPAGRRACGSRSMPRTTWSPAGRGWLGWKRSVRPIRCRCTASRCRSPAPIRRMRRRWPGSRRWCGGSSRRWSRSTSPGRGAARTTCPTCSLSAQRRSTARPLRPRRPGAGRARPDDRPGEPVALPGDRGA